MGWSSANIVILHLTVTGGNWPNYSFYLSIGTGLDLVQGVKPLRFDGIVQVNWVYNVLYFTGSEFQLFLLVFYARMFFKCFKIAVVFSCRYPKAV